MNEREIVFEAQYRSKCPACGEWIDEGDEIVKTADDELVHLECDE